MNYYAITKSDPSAELTHWKYIKREKVNGKWRYQYDKEKLKDDLGFDELEDYNEAKQIHETGLQVYKETSKREGDGVLESLVKAAANSYAKSTLDYTGKKYLESRSKLMKTPIGKLVAAKETIEKGANAISKLFKTKK